MMRNPSASQTARAIVDMLRARYREFPWERGDLQRDVDDVRDIIAAARAEPYSACTGSTNGQACFAEAVYCAEHARAAAATLVGGTADGETVLPGTVVKLPPGTAAIRVDLGIIAAS